MTAPSRAGALSALRMRPLAACLAATIAAAVPGRGAAQPAIEQAATTVIVQNCNDSGPGSLRAAYANAVDNETIDLTQLVCSRITLGSALVDPVAAANVTLRGPGKDLLAIDGDALYQVIVHRGNGGLQEVGADRTAGERVAHELYAFGDRRLVPKRAILLVERHDFAVRTGSRGSARVRQDHQRQEAAQLAVVGQ